MRRAVVPSIGLDLTAPIDLVLTENELHLEKIEVPIDSEVFQ